MFPVRYELGFYIPEYGILHSHRCEITIFTNAFGFMIFGCYKFPFTFFLIQYSL
jgi:hypothetical protein